MPLKPGKLFGPVTTTRDDVKRRPFQPLQARICAPLDRNRVFVGACQASPKTCGGEPGSLRATPPSTTKTPPVFAGCSSSPKAATNRWPAPKANVVGVGIPRATTATAWPSTAFGGGGGPWVASAADAAIAAAARLSARADLRMRPASLQTT